MLALALDTSTLQGTVGWVLTSGDPKELAVDGFAEISAPVSPGHAETLIERLENVLSYGGFKLRDVDLLVFGRGPGTFTGLRIGLSTVKGIAVARDCPIIGISSLEALALSAGVEGKIATVVDAKRGELFGAIYETHMKDGLPVAETIVEEWVGTVDQTLDRIENNAGEKKIFFTGDGASSYGDTLLDRFGSRLEILPERHWSASAYWMARIGLMRFLTSGSDDLDLCVPNYLREPDAKLPGDR